MGFKSYPFAAVITTLLALLLQVTPAAANAHSAGSALIEVRAAGGEALSEDLVEKIEAIPGVSQVEKYLLVRGQLNDKIGVEPGAPLRIFTKDGRLVQGQVEFGRTLRETDAGKRVALVNRVVFASQGMGQDMPGMVHYLGVGSSFTLKGVRFRVAGEVSAPTEAKIFMPLNTAQKLYFKQGVLTHLFVSVKDIDQAEAVQKALADSLGPAVRTTLH